MVMAGPVPAIDFLHHRNFVDARHRTWQGESLQASDQIGIRALRLDAVPLEPFEDLA